MERKLVCETLLSRDHRTSVFLVAARSWELPQSLRLCDERVLQDYASLLVALALLGRELVHPAELGLAVLAHHVAHHMTASQHHAVLNGAERQVDDFLKEISATSRPSEAVRVGKISRQLQNIAISTRKLLPCRYQLTLVRQVGVALRAVVQLVASNVFQEHSTHLVTVIY